MKLPTLWIAVAFAVGILASRFAQLPVAVGAAACAMAIAAACLLLWRGKVAVAWGLALAAWAGAGATAASMERVRVAENSVAQMVEQGRVDTSSPLRWRGRLRSDPADRPWGREYLIDLEQVQGPDAAIAVSGGLRVTAYGALAADASGAALRAGDRVEALARAQPPRDFKDPGAFDARAYLASQGIALTGSLRNAALLTLIDQPRPTLRQRLARMHGALLSRVDGLFAGRPESAALLRAMLLGDRSFVDTDTAAAFQKTASYHVLVVAGLHTAALVVFLLWLCRRLRMGTLWSTGVTLAALAAYVGVVEDRPPIFRAALMATAYLLARPLFRRVDPLNSVALAALCLLLWNPALLADSSFQLSFLAAGVIAALAVPWMQRTTAPYRAGLAHLGDVTRDVVHPPKIAQFRIEARAAAQALAKRLPRVFAARSGALISAPVHVGLRLGDLLLLSLAIQLGMLPLLAQDFHRVSLSGPISNIPAVLLTGIIVPAGFLCLAVSFAWARAATMLAGVLQMLVGALLRVTEWFAAFPRLSYRIPGPPVWLVVAFFAVLLVLAGFARRAAARRRDQLARRRLPPPAGRLELAAAAFAAVLALLIAMYPFAPRLTRGKTEVTVLDVGQGDSIFAAFPDGETMLVDGGGLAGSGWVKGMRSGPDIGEEVVSPYLWSRGIQRLDVVALTHAHEDHLGGLPSVLENFAVRELWIGREEDTREFANLLAVARRRGVRVVHKAEGDAIGWGEVRGKVLWPPAAEASAGASNEDSLVMRFADGATSFLLTGDIEQREERGIVDEDEPLAADFLKVPHHGSKTSSTAVFLDAVRPRVAVVSVGENNAYGHPSESVVERYAEDGVRLLRTDRNGAVTTLSDGHTLSVQAFVPAEAGTMVAQSAKQQQ